MPNENHKPTVSIALATYNGARFIQEQLDSYSSQTVLPDELVVSDDGSSDETLAIGQAFAATAPFPIRILPPGPRLGFSDNFFRAASACRGDLIMFSDQDDVWLPQKIQRQLQSMEPSILLSLHTSVLVDKLLNPIGVFTQDIRKTQIFKPLELDPFLTGWGNTFMFRKEVLAAIPSDSRPHQPENDNLPLSHDSWIYTVAAALGEIAHINEPLILYRQHGNNLCGTTPRSLAQKIRGAMSVPIWRYRARAEFYASLVSLFLNLENSGRSQFDAAAKRARLTFEERLASANARIRLHESNRLLERCRSFMRVCRGRIAEMGSDPTLLWSVLKDLTLGVILHTGTQR